MRKEFLWLMVAIGLAACAPSQQPVAARERIGHTQTRKQTTAQQMDLPYAESKLPGVFKKTTTCNNGIESVEIRAHPENPHLRVITLIARGYTEVGDFIMQFVDGNFVYHRYWGDGDGGLRQIRHLGPRDRRRRTSPLLQTGRDSAHPGWRVLVVDRLAVTRLEEGKPVDNVGKMQPAVLARSARSIDLNVVEPRCERPLAGLDPRYDSSLRHAVAFSAEATRSGRVEGWRGGP